MANNTVNNPTTTNAVQSHFGGGSFTVGSKPDKLGINQDRVVLNRNGGGIINIVDKYDWKNYGLADEVPRIRLTEYEIELGQWASNAYNAFGYVQDSLNNLATAGQKLDPYMALYKVSTDRSNCFSYVFPHLLNDGSNLRDITNQWKDQEGVFDAIKKAATGGQNSSLLGQMAGMIAAAGVGVVTPGIGYEPIMSYDSTEKQTVTISFPLYNTISVQSAFQNYAFVTLFAFQNLKTRTSLVTFIPPKVYTVETLGGGGVYMPLAYVSNYKVDSIGTTRSLKEIVNVGAEILVPEAYRVSISLKELIPQSSNIFLATMGGKKVEIVSDPARSTFTPREP
jgi:hypothetical protein